MPYDDQTIVVGVPLPVRFVAEPLPALDSTLDVVQAKSRAVAERRARLGLPHSFDVNKHLCAMTLHETSFAVLALYNRSCVPLATLAQAWHDWETHRAAVYALAQICVDEFTGDGSGPYSVVGDPRLATAHQQAQHARTAEAERRRGQVADGAACQQVVRDRFLLLRILSFADGIAVHTASRVCQLWRDVANSAELQHLRHFPSPVVVVEKATEW